MIEDSSFCDSDKVQDLFHVIQVNYEPVTLFRLGRKEENKNRPLMVRLNSKEAKAAIMSNLGRLKHAVRRFSERISVTHDYTPEERKMIKELVEDARRRNSNQQNERYKWKVRGMQLVKICVRGHEEDITTRALHRGPGGPAKLNP